MQPLVVPKAKELGIKVIKSMAEVRAFAKAHLRAGGAEALVSMMEGNLRYVQKMTKNNSDRNESEVSRFINAQKPFATMLSCADSRVKISRIFDKKDGRIFSIKNAGNHAYSNFTLADLEYGVMHLHTPLLIVMGHEKCGALSATCTHKGRINEGHLSVLAMHLNASAQRAGYDIDAAILLNIFDTIGQIRERSDIIAGLERGGKVDILAMYYSISSGHAALLVPCENNSLIINNIRR